MLSVFSVCLIWYSLAMPGGWEGKADFKMSFLNGGAIEVGEHLFKLATNGSYAQVLQCCHFKFT